jgi:hypothetical protein
MNWLEQLAAEWYEFRARWVRVRSGCACLRSAYS